MKRIHCFDLLIVGRRLVVLRFAYSFLVHFSSISLLILLYWPAMSMDRFILTGTPGRALFDMAFSSLPLKSALLRRQL
jgi:hypothetical protein